MNNGFHPHVWYDNSGDIFRRNIVWLTYNPASMHKTPWGAEMDFNLIHSAGAVQSSPANALQGQSGRDVHSIVGDAQFVDPLHGDYRVQEKSPALKLGFKNFPMDRFGVQKPELRRIARSPEFPIVSGSGPIGRSRESKPISWLGAKVRNINSEGEMSAFGLPAVIGVLVLEVPITSKLSHAGLKRNDVILSVNGVKVRDTRDLPLQEGLRSNIQISKIEVSRDQKVFTISLVH